MKLMLKLLGLMLKVAKEFMSFMMSETFQNIIPTTNWMYPAALPASQLPEGFGGLVKPSATLLFSDVEIAANRKQWVNEWLEALAK